MGRWFCMVLMLCCLGCSTTSTSDVSLETLRLFDPAKSDQPIWWNWTPAKTPQASAPSLSWRVFDYWLVQDDALVGVFWQGLYPVLDMLRLQKKASAPARATVTALMTLLDEDKTRQRWMDLTFVVDAKAGWEGVVCRLYGKHKTNGATYGLSLVFKRPVGQLQPTSVLLWGVSGFEQGAAMTALLSRKAGSLMMEDGLKTSPRVVVERSPSVPLMIDILQKMIWSKVSGTAYNEPKIKVDRKGRVARVANFPVGLGVKLQPRKIEEVLKQTVFVPQMDLDNFDFKAPKKPSM